VWCDRVPDKGGAISDGWEERIAKAHTGSKVGEYADYAYPEGEENKGCSNGQDYLPKLTKKKKSKGFRNSFHKFLKRILISI